MVPGGLSGETAHLYGPSFFQGRSETVTASAAVVVPIVLDFVSATSVVDIGCGQGEWLDAFPGEMDKFGVDIAAPQRSGFLRADLCQPLYLGSLFDLALSLETGEHLPEDAADVYVGSISRHSDVVLFSAATPGQEGKGHINCQPHSYWHAMFETQGYTVHDVIRPRIAMDTRVSPWYRDNTFLYRRGR